MILHVRRVERADWTAYRFVVQSRRSCSGDIQKLFAWMPRIMSTVTGTVAVRRRCMLFDFRFCLLQFVITDGLGHGRCVMYSLMRNERCSTYTSSLMDFRNMMPNASAVQTFVVDMSLPQMRAIGAVFPAKNILLCQFHMLRAVRRKVRNCILLIYGCFSVKRGLCGIW